jgi:HSP20 family protein
MRLTRWPTFNPVWQQLQQLQSEMNRLFEHWNDGGRLAGAVLGAAYPPVNMWEDTEHVCVEAELPGMDLNDLEIYVTGSNQLTIKGVRKHNLPEKGAWHRQERGYGAFVRTLELPYDVNRDNVDARLENGILLVKLAKAESAKPRKIVVKGE